MENLTLLFSVTPPRVGVGGFARLQWKTTGATSVVLDPGGEILASSGSKFISVPQTTFFTVTARSKTDIRQEQKVIEVDPTIVGGDAVLDVTHAGVSETLLSYSILTSPNPLEANTPGVLTAVVSNSTGDVVICERIVFTLPVGTNAKDLIVDGVGIESAPPRGWNVSNENGVLTCTPQTSERGEIGGEGLSFTFSRFMANSKFGTSRIDIDEVASTEFDRKQERTTSIPVPKFPAQFAVSGLRFEGLEEPYQVPSGGTVTVDWNGTAVPGATYTISYQPKDEGSGLPPVRVGNNGPYGSVALTRTGSVTFTLTVAIPVPGQDMPLVVQRQLTVSVITLSLSLVVQPTSVGVNGLALLQWEALNASKCLLDPGGETVPAIGSRYVIVPQTTYFTVTATGFGRVKQEQKQIAVNPAIVPNIPGHSIVGADGRAGIPGGVAPIPGRPGVDGGDARLSVKLPPFDTSSRPARVMRITLTGGNGGPGGEGGSVLGINPTGQGAPGGNGGRGGDVVLDSTFDPSAGAPAQFVVIIKPGTGGEGGKGGGGQTVGPNGTRGRDGTVTLRPR